MSTTHIDPPIRLHRVVKASQRIADGTYDNAEVLDVATSRLHAELLQLMTIDAAHAERLANDLSEPGREHDGGI